MRPRRKHRMLRFLAGLALLLGLAVADSNLRLVTTEYRLSYPNLPAGFEGYRILQLSDLHGAVFGKDNARLLAAVRKTQPDLIALTGDLADESTDLETVDALLGALAEIAPVYYVSGNHEWAARRLRSLIPMLERHGVRYLRNEWMYLEQNGDSIVLLGVEDPCGPADMPKPDAVAAAAPEGFRLMLAHRNELAEQYPELPVDLLLVGHAHGGVWRIPGVGGLLDHRYRLFPDDAEGVIASGRMNMVVSRGLGNIGLSFRLLNNPELVLVTLHRA